MRISNIRVNGMVNPIGYDFQDIRITYSVEDFSNEEAQQKTASFDVIISEKKDFSEVLFSKKSNTPEITIAELHVKPRTRYYVCVLIDGQNTCEESYFETGKLQEAWSGKWITTEDADCFHPIFSKQILTTEKIEKARLYICGLGLYEAYINGHRVGNEYLSPGVYDYAQELQYQTYDVTEYMNLSNHFQVLLGKGWYMGRFGLEGNSELYGNRFQMIAELHMELASGRKMVVGSDNSFVYYGSDIEDSGIYDGEIYNHTLFLGKNNAEKQAVCIEESRPLKARVGVPIVEKDRLQVREVIVTPDGDTVLDFGQNMAGYVSFKCNLPLGSRVQLLFGEVLQNGCFYNDNYRSATGGFTYVSGGYEEEVWPHFTYFGFRYVCVRGWNGAINPDDFQAHVIYNDLERTGYFTCSNEKINRLYENAFWGQRSNFIDLPTDCPQRDERMGWTGDIQVFTPAASYNMDTRAFLNKFLYDLRKEQQLLQGGIPNYLPNMGNLSGSCAIWGDAATFIPDAMAEMFGDGVERSTYYPLMKDWCEYCIRQFLGTDHLVHGMFGFGDWLALDGVTQQSMRGGTDDDYIASMYLQESLKKTAKMAGILGKEEDQDRFAQLANMVKDAILAEYFTQAGHLSVDTQTGYILALRFSVYRDLDVLKKDFLRRLKRDGYRIRCGFAGAPVLCQTLCENAMPQLAYHFLRNEEFPGWLHEVNMGATTIWERWNSLNEDGSISGTGMNSLNHYAYGTVVEFLYKYMCGIRPGAEGFRVAEIKPYIDGHFSYAKGAYNSVYGKYVCNWEIGQDGQLSVHIEIPYGAQAKVCLPEREAVMLGGGTYDICYKPERNPLQIYNLESFVGEVVQDARAVEILQELAPQALFLGQSDVEGKTTLLGELPYMFYLGIAPDKASEAVGRICVLAGERND